MKSCSRCKILKPIEDYCVRSSSKDGHDYHCRECNKYFNNRNFRNRNLKSKYGITEQQFDQMVIEQDGKCALCGVELIKARKPCVDHDHTTGKVRGILCCKCNTGLGKFNDNVELLARAISYLS